MTVSLSEPLLQFADRRTLFDNTSRNSNKKMGELHSANCFAVWPVIHLIKKSPPEAGIDPQHFARNASVLTTPPRAHI